MMITQPIRFASLTFAFSCIAALLAASHASAQNSSLEFPYQALVAKDNALVRSGPGEVHYGTQKLAAGQVVEVHRHDPDGWCAIRPVEGSFDIIPEATVDIISEGVGEIKMAGTTPFVGTKLGTVEKPLWQVKLREKEKVSLIGQLSWPNPEGHSTVWYQIKPPAGEFRWINISNLESLSGETMASVVRPKPKKKTVAPMPSQPVRPAANSPIAKSSIADPRPTAALDRPASITPVKPSSDSATAQQQSATILEMLSRLFQLLASLPLEQSSQTISLLINPRFSLPPMHLLLQRPLQHLHYRTVMAVGAEPLARFLPTIHQKVRTVDSLNLRCPETSDLNLIPEKMTATQVSPTETSKPLINQTPIQIELTSQTISILTNSNKAMRVRSALPAPIQIKINLLNSSVKLAD